MDRWRERERKQDWRAALVACVIANVHRGKRRPYKPDDFLPQQEERQGTAKQLYWHLRAWAAGLKRRRVKEK